MAKMDNPTSYYHDRYHKIVNRVTATILSILWGVSVWMFVLPAYGNVGQWKTGETIFMFCLFAIAVPCVIVLAVLLIFCVIFPGIGQFIHWLQGYD